MWDISKLLIESGNRELVPFSLFGIPKFQKCRSGLREPGTSSLFLIWEYCEVSVEGAFINMKLIIGNRESGTGNYVI